MSTDKKSDKAMGNHKHESKSIQEIEKAVSDLGIKTDSKTPEARLIEKEKLLSAYKRISYLKIIELERELHKEQATRCLAEKKVSQFRILVKQLQPQTASISDSSSYPSDHHSTSLLKSNPNSLSIQPDNIEQPNQRSDLGKKRNSSDLETCNIPTSLQQTLDRFSASYHGSSSSANSSSSTQDPLYRMASAAFQSAFGLPQEHKTDCDDNIDIPGITADTIVVGDQDDMTPNKKPRPSRPTGVGRGAIGLRRNSRIFTPETVRSSYRICAFGL